MFSSIKEFCNDLTQKFDDIPAERKVILEKISAYINTKRAASQNVNLVYICTHNSRRSHFGQVWGKVASVYYGIKNINTYSGGTEVTAFNTNAINSLIRTGFDIKAETAEANPTRYVYFSENENPIACYSKVYDDPNNPSSEFAAIMTCSEAEVNCPFVQGAEFRISTTYEDPKLFDKSPLRNSKYDERSKQIALESLYVFSKVV